MVLAYTITNLFSKQITNTLKYLLLFKFSRFLSRSSVQLSQSVGECDFSVYDAFAFCCRNSSSLYAGFIFSGVLSFFYLSHKQIKRVTVCFFYKLGLLFSALFFCSVELFGFFLPFQCFTPFRFRIAFSLSIQSGASRQNK